MSIRKKGIDISVWNGNIDVGKIKESGIDFVILREGYRNTVDSKFFENVKKCKDAGLPVVGVYHFSYALNTKQAKQEANACIYNIQKAGLGKDTIVFFDFEYDSVTKAAALGVKLGKKECNAHTNAFCETVESYGYRAGVYYNIDYYKNWYDHSLLKNYVNWLADWTGDADYPCEFHQYSSQGKVPGIVGDVDMNYFYGKETEISVKTRQSVVDLALTWEGKKESDGSYKSIIDIYNSYSGSFPRGIKMQYGWAWCACMWSALAIKLGYTSIIPIEISCGYLIENAKKMGCWQEKDSYVPDIGDGVLYDWDDNGMGDNVGWPDHVGVVIEVNESAGYMIVLEGNCGKAVKRRTLAINGKFIRGFITPAYDKSENVSIEQNTQNLTATSKEEIVVDGYWGKITTRKAQQIFGTTVDGIVSNQWAMYKKVNPGLSTGWYWKDKPNGHGSQLIKAIQKWCGMTGDRIDGEIGPETIKAIQRKLGCTIIDGTVSAPSNMVRAFQKYLNNK